MPPSSDAPGIDDLKKGIIGLGEKSVRKSYYPELQSRIAELERANAELLKEMRIREAAQKNERKTEQKYRTLFDAMTEMVVIHEVVFDDSGNAVDYRILQCNRAFTQILGIPAETATGKLASDVYSSIPPPYLDIYAAVAITGTPHEFTDYYPPQEKYFNISVVSPGKNLFATITTDVTAIQEIKELVTAKNRELENYLYVASHDLRSPLVNIQGFSARLLKQTSGLSEILSGSPDDRKTAEATAQLREIITNGIPQTIDFIFKNVLKMDKLISGLLQISRTGRIAMSIQRVDMMGVMKTVVDERAYEIEQSGASIEIREIPPCWGDVHLLNQLFSNIVGNALKYRDRSRPLQITIGAKQYRRRVVYSVTDNGIGIAARHLERIWDVFYRVDWKGTVEGDGIGLSIVKRIVDKHCGKIRVESTEGVGSTFFIDLLSEEFAARE
jgi:signal transduction histidine kinase